MTDDQRRRRFVLIAIGGLACAAVVLIASVEMDTEASRGEERTRVPSARDTLPPPVASAPAPTERAEGSRDAPERGPKENDAGPRSSTAPWKRPGSRGSVLVDDGVEPRSPGARAGLDKDEVRAGIAAVKERVRSCYERALDVDPALGGGVVKVTFTLEGDGRGNGQVTAGEIAGSDMNSPFFEACVLQEVARAEFPAPSGGGVVAVTYPFRFSADDADAGR